MPTRPAQPGRNVMLTGCAAFGRDSFAEVTNVDVSLVIPTFNERDSVAPLLSELKAALTGLSWEAVFVDDSSDETDDVIRRIGLLDPRVRVLHRHENKDGLAGAVIDGL